MDKLKLLNLDYELSVEVFEKCSDIIEKKSCYKNIALSLLEYVDYEEKFDEVKIVFGGFKPIDSLTEDNIFFRHCFYILNDKVIDPTLIYLIRNGDIDVDIEKVKANTVYFNVISFDKDDYKEKLSECMGATSLDKYTMKPLNDFQMKLYIEQNILMVG